MLLLPQSVSIYLAVEPVDMRKSFDGLVAIVQSSLHLDPFTGHLFCFVSKRRDRIKVLMLGRGGFAVFYKRLEKGSFPLPPFDPEARTVELEAPQLAMLLDALDFSTMKAPKRWAPPKPKENVPQGIDTRLDLRSKLHVGLERADQP